MTSVKAPRPYDSPLRAAQAEDTRARILDAARELIGARGYFETSLDAVARAAGISAQRLYAIHGSKPALLLALIRDLKERVGVNERAAALIADPDPVRQLDLTASLTREYSEQGLAILDAARDAARTQDEVAAVWSQVEGWRHRGNRRVIDALDAHGALRSDLSRAEATDIFWSLTAHDLYRLLVVDRRWSGAAYERWLARQLRESLIA